MMPALPRDRYEQLAVYWTGFVVLSAALIGGGTASYLVADRFIQTIALPLGAYALIRRNCIDASKAHLFWFVALVGVLLTSLLFALPIGDAWGSSAPHFAISYGSFALAVLCLHVFVLTLTPWGVHRLVVLFVIAATVNALMAAIQLSFSASTNLDWAYQPQVGFFANGNHFASLIYATLPLLAWLLLAQAKSPWLFAASGLFFGIVLFATSSVAAIVIFSILAVVCVVLFSVDRYGRVATGFGGLASLSVLLFAGGLLMMRGLPVQSNELRFQFWSNSWAIIVDHFPFGTGIGSFHLIYPRYETLDQDLSVVANHAHNDWLELLLETGLAGPVLGLVLCIQAVIAAFKSALHRAMAICLLALAVHSLVDYPLRTMMIALLASFAAAIVWRSADIDHDTNQNRQSVNN